jgi:pre-mRNA-processing factor 40
MQDDLRYALKKLSEPIDVNMTFEEVSQVGITYVRHANLVQATPAMEHLPEFQALGDEGRRAAFSKFVKRQKERLREASDDGGSSSGRRRKEPSGRDSHRDDRDYYERDRDRDRGKSSDRYARDKDHYTSRNGSGRRGSEYERDERRRGSRHDREWDASHDSHSREKRELSYDEKADNRSEKV